MRHSRYRANDGKPSKRFDLGHGLTLEIYKSYPGYDGIICQNGQRWLCGSFRLWKKGKWQWEHNCGTKFVEYVQKTAADQFWVNGGNLACQLINRWHFCPDSYTPDVLRLPA